MIFSYFKHFFIFSNVNEHLVVTFVELAGGGSCVGHFHFFCLLRATCMSLILFVAWNIPYQTQMCPPFISPLWLFQATTCNIYSVNPLIYRGLGFFKNHRRGSKFSCTNGVVGGGGGVAHIKGCLYKRR